jgi:hypothetical protein
VFDSTDDASVQKFSRSPAEVIPLDRRSQSFLPWKLKQQESRCEIGGKNCHSEGHTTYPRGHFCEPALADM